MRHIRRAAVSGLFALWLAPLGAAADVPTNGSASLGSGARTQIEGRIAETRRRDPEDRRLQQDGEDDEG